MLQVEEEGVMSAVVHGDEMRCDLQIRVSSLSGRQASGQGRGQGRGQGSELVLKEGAYP